MKTGLFGKSISVSFILGGFTMSWNRLLNASAATRPFHLRDFYVWSVPMRCYTTILWKICSWLGRHIFHMAYQYHTCCCMEVCTCKVWIQRERFRFSHYLWNTWWYHWFIVFSMATTKWAVVAMQGPDVPLSLTCFFVLLELKQGACGLSVFAQCSRLFVSYHIFRT